MAISFEDYVKNGNCNITTTATTSKLTEHLRSWVTVPKYYQGQLDEISKGSKRALKSIKKLPSGEYQLKIQLGKFAHGLIVQDGEEYRSATFPTKPEAYFSEPSLSISWICSSFPRFLIYQDTLKV